jgi:drug/metabolite transporter (DMT)-like permease
MTWQIAVILRILIGNILSSILFKKAADSTQRTKQQFFVYSFCAVFSLGLLLYTKSFVFSLAIVIVALLGFINSIAFFSHLRAVKISQSKSSIFMPGSDIFAMLLGYTFLNELQFLDPLLLLGILLISSSAILFVISSHKTPEHTNPETKKLFFWVVIYTFIWGLVAFFMRWFALEGLSFTEFGTSWYFSSWIGSLIIYSLNSKKKNNTKLNPGAIFNSFGIALFVWLSLLLSYTALERAPITVVQPIFMASGMVFPVLIGLFIFKEIKKITLIEIIALLIGVAGGIIIGFSS